MLPVGLCTCLWLQTKMVMTVEWIYSCSDSKQGDWMLHDHDAVKRKKNTKD